MPNETVKARRPQVRFTIEVAEQDIAEAHVGDSYKCVVARAIARKIPDASRIEVDTQTIRFTRNKEGAEGRYVYMTPWVVQGYVMAFDAGDPIEPFDFRIDRPYPVRRRTRTEAGKAATRAASAARREAVKSGKSKPEALADARTAYAETRQREPGKDAAIEKGRRPPPRVFKTKSRDYGHRRLRINRDE